MYHRSGLLRVTAESVWRDEVVRDRLSWYYDVLRDEKPAKFLICKSVSSDADPLRLTDEELWRKHEALQQIFLKTWRNIRESSQSWSELENQPFSFLDVKVELLKRILRKCVLCEWRCRVDRVEGKRLGACHLDAEARVATFFQHFGEEPPLVDRHGSGTIFFASCTFRCAFCVHPSTEIITQSGPTQIAEIFAAANGKTAKGEGRIAWPSELLTVDHRGHVVGVRKAFRHKYSGRMLTVKPYFLPAIITTPDHEIYATPWPGILPLTKIKASELKKGWFLAIPKFSSFESSDVLRVAEVLGTPTSLYRKSTKITRVKARTILRLRREGYTSKRIAEEVGLTPSYLRKIAPALERYGITDRLFWGENPMLDKGDHVRYKMEKPPYIPSSIELDERLASLLGYYCAEGFVRKARERPNTYSLSFSFGRHESHLAQRTGGLIAEIFGIRPRLVRRKSTITVESGKTSLALLLARLCGFKSHEKRVPPLIFSAKRNIVKAFLQAYVQGDGSNTQNFMSTNTVSLELAKGLCWLFLRLNVIPRFYEYKPSPHKKIEERTVRQSVLYYVKVPLDDYQRKVLDQNVPQLGRRYRLCSEDENYLYVLTRRVTSFQYSGPVFNMETAEDSHSYLANFFAAGNCQNWDISQNPDAGAPVSAKRLSLIIKSLRNDGAANINFVGGEPTPNLHVIVDALGHTNVSVPILWNSNMYLTPEAMQILADVTDIWLPDFKWGNDQCAIRYSRILRYFEVVSRNHGTAHENGDMIIRHLVMPGHMECCTKPILEWIARNCPRALVNIMGQYRPEYLVAREPKKYETIARRLTLRELAEARSQADKLGLVWEPVS